MQGVEKHIFIGAPLQFNEKLSLFRDIFVDSLVGMGFIDSENSLLEIEFTKSNKYNQDLFQELIIDLTFESPLIVIDFIENNKKLANCMIFYSTVNPLIEGAYMVENLINYNGQGKTSCKIYDLFPCKPSEINHHWL